MLQNNLVALLIQVAVNVFVLLTYGLISGGSKWGFGGEILFFLGVLSLFFWTGYLLTGRLLNVFQTKVGNLASLSSIFGLGLLVWLIRFIASDWWVFECLLYVYYAAPLYPIFKYLHFGNPFQLVDLELLFSLLPTLLIWAGLEAKKLKTE